MNPTKSEFSKDGAAAEASNMSAYKRFMEGLAKLGEVVTYPRPRPLIGKRKQKWCRRQAYKAGVR